MTVFENLKTKTIDELARWLDKYAYTDHCLWIKWFDKNYCSKCKPEFTYVPIFERECECAWCEINGKCKFFQELDEIPDNEEIIKMWLKSEAE